MSSTTTNGLPSSQPQSVPNETTFNPTKPIHPIIHPEIIAYLPDTSPTNHILVSGTSTCTDANNNNTRHCKACEKLNKTSHTFQEPSFTPAVLFANVTIFLHQEFWAVHQMQDGVANGPMSKFEVFEHLPRIISTRSRAVCRRTSTGLERLGEHLVISGDYSTSLGVGRCTKQVDEVEEDLKRSHQILDVLAHDLYPVWNDYYVRVEKGEVMVWEGA